MGIHRLFHSSCCFLNTNTVITQQLIWTARMLEAECWQVYGELWVGGQKKMSQILGTFRLPDFTMLWPVLTWCVFWNLWTVYLSNFPNFFQFTVCKPDYSGFTLILLDRTANLAWYFTENPNETFMFRMVIFCFRWIYCLHLQSDWTGSSRQRNDGMEQNMYFIQEDCANSASHSSEGAGSTSLQNTILFSHHMS